MIRRLFVRLFFIALTLAGVTTFAAGTAGYFATRTPTFYAERCAEPFSATERELAEIYFRSLEKRFRSWSEQIASQELVAERKEGVMGALAALVGAAAKPRDSYVVNIDERQLNAMLSSADDDREWRRPRIQITDNQIDFAATLASPGLDCVLSVSICPTLTPDRELQLDIVAIRVGKLPLPLQMICRWLPEDANKLEDDETTLDFSGEIPRVYLKKLEASAESPRVGSISCTEGTLAIEFLLPEKGA